MPPFATRMQKTGWPVSPVIKAGDDGFMITKFRRVASQAISASPFALANGPQDLVLSETEGA